ncbi:MAG: class I SAM-dependent methyltransferase, partial [Planctomycetota bacterium]
MINNRILTTAQRKLGKSLKQRGILTTTLRCLTRPLRHVAGSFIWLSPEFRRIRREHHEWDTKHKVDTSPKMDAGWLSEIDSPNWEFARGYHPVTADALKAVITNLSIDWTQYAFIDFGSGKGRSLFVASDFPFAEIYGVEFSPALHEVAVANVRTYQNPVQKCFQIHPVLSDAATYQIPNRPTVFYLYDPFGEPVISKVFQRITDACRAVESPCYVI